MQRKSASLFSKEREAPVFLKPAFLRRFSPPCYMSFLFVLCPFCSVFFFFIFLPKWKHLCQLCFLHGPSPVDLAATPLHHLFFTKSEPPAPPKETRSGFYQLRSSSLHPQSRHTRPTIGTTGHPITRRHAPHLRRGTTHWSTLLTFFFCISIAFVVFMLYFLCISVFVLFVGSNLLGLFQSHMLKEIMCSVVPSPSTSFQWLMSLPSKGTSRVEEYCKGHASICVLFWGSSRVEGSCDGHAPTHIICFGDFTTLCGPFLGFCPK